MPEIVKTDIVAELREMARLMRRGCYASSADDAEFIVEAAAREIDSLREQVRILVMQKHRWMHLAGGDD